MVQARRYFAAVVTAAVSLFALAPAVSAQSWPTRPITFIISQSPGSSPDVMARLMSEPLAKALGQGVVIENKPGGGNVIGALAAARAAPDGYTFFFATSAALVTNPYLMKTLGYDPVKDFTPVSLVTRSHQVLVVHPDVPVKTLTELIALDKKAPGKMSAGVDSPRNLAGVTVQALNKQGGTTFVLVPYPNINVGLQDTVAGRVQTGVFSISIAEALIRDGKLRPIAVASATGSKILPGVPTIAATIPGFDFGGWFMLMAPKGTPPQIVQRMNAEIDKALADPKVREMAPKIGFETDGGSIAAAEKYLAEQLALWGKITKDLGIEPQ